MSALDSRAPQAPPAPPPAPARQPAGAVRWAADLLMGARFALTGGREGWIRTALTAVGVGLGVAVLMVAASVPAMLDARDARGAARAVSVFGPEAERSERSVLVLEDGTEFRDKGIHGRIVQREGSRPPVPPGLDEFPAPGEMAVSPALRELLSSPEGELLKKRLPHRIVGTIGEEGLVGPRELSYVLGSDELDGTGLAHRTDRFGTDHEPESLDAVLLLLVVVVCVVLLLPVAVFVATAVRFGGERRDRRLAALRLVGADSRMVRRIAAGESLVGALLGLAVGAALFWPIRLLIGEAELFGISVFPSDVRPSAPILALILLAVPACAVAVTLFALRGVAIEPLGVVRQAGARGRRLWWRMALPAAGLLLLAPSFGGISSDEETIDTYRITAGIVLLLAGVTVVLPWVVEKAVGRLRGGPLSLQLAIRRLQLDSGPAARAVGGITVAVAGAIAIQMFFSGVSGAYTKDTGQDPRRAQIQIGSAVEDGGGTRELVERLEAARGVREVLGTTTGHYLTVGADPNGDVPYTRVSVADCATLRELARITACAEGDVFIVRSEDSGDGEDGLGERPGARLDLNPPRYDEDEGAYEQAGDRVPWTVPGDAREVEARTSPQGEMIYGILATPQAIDASAMREARAEIMVRIDREVPDAVEHVRNAAETGRPATDVMVLAATREVEEFAAIRKALHIGAAGVLLLIGAGMVVSTLEQLRERRRLLSVLVAFGTRRSTLGWSVLWQTALPVVLGLALAVAGGIGLGAALLATVSTPVAVDWAGIAAVTGLGAAVILLVTALSLPPLWRMMRPDGLRTE
ncbi:ABC transporter permease [Streptomyces glaucosporus]|uniref:ABC transporter permease n=1 Tax=Streptomyces glaucosporus TaxID=284044 RepID=A0ABP5V8C8_9ACTN